MHEVAWKCLFVKRKFICILMRSRVDTLDDLAPMLDKVLIRHTCPIVAKGRRHSLVGCGNREAQHS